MLAAHLQELGQKHHIQIEYHSGLNEESKADLDANHISVQTITTRARYAIALHEVGHLVTKTKTHPRLFQEGAAWAWARQHALCWTPSMQRAMIVGLLSYFDALCADRDQALSGQLRAPPRTHPFWVLLNEEPVVRNLLSKKLPHWINPDLVTIPWGNVLNHPERPRCSNCAYWRHLAALDSATTRDKLDMGECVHKLRPLGTEMTPSGALCAKSWVRSPE